MTGLKIFNEENKELVFYPNAYTKEYIKDDIEEGVLRSSYKHQTLLDQIENHKIYLLWIKLPESQEIKPNQSMILKLHYY